MRTNTIRSGKVTALATAIVALTLAGMPAYAAKKTKPGPGGSPSSSEAQGGKPVAVVVELSADAQQISESGGTLSVTVTSTPIANHPISVPFTVSGSASNPEDHNVPSVGTIEIPAGSATATATFKIVDDALFENSESIVITLGNPSGRRVKPSLGARAVQTITLSDNDLAPKIQFSSATQSVREDMASVTATLQLSAASGKTTTVPFTVAGSASNPSDHDLASGSVSVPAGSTTASIQFRLVKDSLHEGDETVVLNLGTPVNATLGVNVSQTVNVIDVDPAPVVQFDLVEQVQPESAGTVVLSLSLSGKSADEVSIPYTVSGTASNPGDHDLAAGVIKVPAGSQAASLRISLVDDTLTEGNETIVVSLGAPVGGSLGTRAVHTLTIQDNDVEAPPLARWSAGFQSVAEGVGVVTATVTLDKAAALDVTIPYLVTGTAVAPGDHDLVNGSVRIPAGMLMGSVTFSLVDDAVFEGDETIILSLGTPPGAALGSPAVHQVNVADNDTAPEFEFSVASQIVGEAAGTVTVTARLNKISVKDASASYSVGGTSASPSDHNLSAGTIMIPAGSTSKQLSFTLVDDALYEGGETVDLTLSNPVNAILGTQVTHRVNITDNELAPIARFNAATQVVQESVGEATIVVALDRASSKVVNIPYTVSGTASYSGDHDLAAGTLGIPAGQSSAAISVTLVKDAVAEVDETLIVTLGTPMGGTLGTPAVHTLTITDRILNPTVQWQIASQTAQESAGTVKVAASLNAPASASVIVPFTVTGTASRPGDHDLASGSLTIPAGATSADVSIRLVDDALDEEDETVILTMGTPSGAIAGATRIHTLTVIDNDAPPLVQFSGASQSILESAGTASVSVTLSAASAKPISVAFAVSGTASNPSDHNLGAGSISIPPGSTTGTVSFIVVDDTLVESGETVVLTLGSATNATLGVSKVHTVTIQDNEATPTIQWSVASQIAQENGGTITVTATLSAAISGTLMVPFTVGGTASAPADHDLASGTLTILAGGLNANVSIQLVNDTLFEGSETIVLTLGNPTPSIVSLGTRTVHTVTIADDEAEPTVQFSLASQSALESAGTVAVVVTLNKASALPVSVPFTVSGTAVNPSDHTLASGSVSFSAGVTSRSISVPIVNDTLNESDETVVLTLGTPSGATLGTAKVHTLTIQDNDALPVVQWSLASQSVAESAGAVILTASLSAGSATQVSVPVTVTAGSTAKAPGDYSVSSTNVLFPVGSTSVSYVVNVVNDVLNEGTESVTFVMGTPTGAALGTIVNHTLTIQDNDAAPTVQWTLARQDADENKTSAVAVAQLSAPSGKTITVSYGVSGNANNSALGRTKYNLSPGTLTIPAGNTTVNLTVPLVNDVAAGPSDLYVSLSLQNPVDATLGSIATQLITIIDNDVALVRGEEGYRTTVWPIARARCIGCHGVSSFLPVHASDVLKSARDSARPLANFTDVPSSRLVIKGSDSHCGDVTKCGLTGSANDTKPLMIAAIQAWAPYETTQASPSPSPSVTPSPSPTGNPGVLAGGTVGIKDSRQYLQFLTSTMGLDEATYRFSQPYTGLSERMSGDGDPTSVTATMTMAYAGLAAKVCADFVTKEKALAMSSRKAFAAINFTTSTNIPGTVLTQANMNSVTMSLARMFWMRDPTAVELTAIYDMVLASVAGRVTSTGDTQYLMTTTCMAMASSIESIHY